MGFLGTLQKSAVWWVKVPHTKTGALFILWYLVILDIYRGGIHCRSPPTQVHDAFLQAEPMRLEKSPWKKKQKLQILNP